MGILPKPNDKTGEWAAQRDPLIRGQRLMAYQIAREKRVLKLAAARERRRAVSRLLTALDAA